MTTITTLWFRLFICRNTVTSVKRPVFLAAALAVAFPSLLVLGVTILPQNLQAVRYFEIGPNEAGQRIDNFLLKILKNVPKSHVYRLLRSGQVRVNKGRIKPAYRLEEGDNVRVPPVRQPETVAIRPPDDLCERLLRRVLHEDDKLLIIDKPSGLAVHGGTGMKFGVIEVMRQARQDLAFLELAHRLDRATSGCLVLVKSRQALVEVNEGFRSGAHEKRYLTLLLGKWKGGERRIELNLQGQRSQGGERMVEVDDEGKEAISYFKPLEVWPQASYMEVKIDTGRMHQIRVHAAELAHPVAGDEKYGDRTAHKTMRDYGLRRMFLHAHSLRLVTSAGELSVSSPLPIELNSVIEKLRDTA